MGARVFACVLVYLGAHRKRIVGQSGNNTADCFPLTKRVCFLVVKQGRFTACGFKRLETEAVLGRECSPLSRQQKCYWHYPTE